MPSPVILVGEDPQRVRIRRSLRFDSSNVSCPRSLGGAMNLAEVHLQAEPGEGVTAYFGSVALLALDIPASGSPFFDELLAVVQAAATSEGGEAGRSLVRQIARLITRTAAEQTVPFGLVADAGDS